MNKVFLLCLLLLSSCTPLFSEQEIESNCFNKYDTTPLDIFSSLPSDSDAFLWLLKHGGSENNSFLINSQINGYLMPENITMDMEHVINQTVVTITGRVFKLWPSWGEFNIGGGRKSLNIEVLIKGKKYLLMEQFINIDLKLNLPKRCQFTE
jgi:hypothetical protein